MVGAPRRRRRQGHGHHPLPDRRLAARPHRGALRLRPGHGLQRLRGARLRVVRQPRLLLPAPVRLARRRGAADARRRPGRLPPLGALVPPAGGGDAGGARPRARAPHRLREARRAALVHRRPPLRPALGGRHAGGHRLVLALAVRARRGDAGGPHRPAVRGAAHRPPPRRGDGARPRQRRGARRHRPGARRPQSYRSSRLHSFLDPFKDPLNTGFQNAQSLLALGSGGLRGVGLGNSIQKFQWLPEAHTDFIFAIIGEELGLIGCLAVITAFFLLGWRGVRASMRAPDAFGALLAGGIVGWICIQAF
ncbi:MAG: hypothetical protein E6I76_11870, partial [Chloroflexi bacterium]